LPPKGILLELAARSEFPACSRTAVSVGRFHYAVGHSLGSVVFREAGFDGHSQVSQSSPLFELKPSSGVFYQRGLAGPPQRTSPSHGLCFPTAHQEPKVHFPRALPARYVPPSGFGYPPDGLLPSVPRQLCFAPAALMGFALRSVLLPQGIPRVTAGKRPPAVFPVFFPAALNDGPVQRAAASGF